MSDQHQPPHGQQWQQPPHFPQQGQQPPPPYGAYPPLGPPTKNHAVAIILSLFLGTLGIDRFYLGHIGLGIAKLLLSWATFGIWQLIDLIVIITKGTQTLKAIRWE
ncbi:MULTISPECIES: TM2 domain-containing protein [Actinomycetes]